MSIPALYPHRPPFSTFLTLINNPLTTIYDVHILLGMGPSMGLCFTSQEPKPWRKLSLSSQKLSAVRNFSATGGNSWTHPHCMLESWLTWTCEGTHMCYEPISTTVLSCLERFALFLPSLTSSLTMFLPYLLWGSLSLGAGVWHRCPCHDWPHSSVTFSVL